MLPSLLAEKAGKLMSDHDSVDKERAAFEAERRRAFGPEVAPFTEECRELTDEEWEQHKRQRKDRDDWLQAQLPPLSGEPRELTEEERDKLNKMRERLESPRRPKPAPTQYKTPSFEDIVKWIATLIGMMLALSAFKALAEWLAS